MKREVFADKEVEKLVNDNVIPITIDIDNPNAKEIVQYFRVGATPTTIIVDSRGEVLDYAVGKIDKKKFLEMLNNSETK
jgi:protein disulfide-isomerase